MPPICIGCGGPIPIGTPHVVLTGADLEVHLHLSCLGALGARATAIATAEG
jgi:hypothetical protein